MTRRQTSALPIYCARCKDEIDLPGTYLIVPQGGFRGLYHMGCQPLTVDSEIVSAETASQTKEQ